MAKSQETYSKKEKEKLRIKKKQDKAKLKEERKSNSKGGGLANMMAYVDHLGNIVDTPPDETLNIEIDAEDIEIGVPKGERRENPAIRKGKVAFFNTEKGYGFIAENGTGEKYFVHANGLLEEIKENDNVSFELERGLKGMNAIKVQIV
jgi:cold shock CspA family protein